LAEVVEHLLSLKLLLYTDAAVFFPEEFLEDNIDRLM
jgi:hypothetical protein